MPTAVNGPSSRTRQSRVPTLRSSSRGLDAFTTLTKAGAAIDTGAKDYVLGSCITPTGKRAPCKKRTLNEVNSESPSPNHGRHPKRQAIRDPEPKTPRQRLPQSSPFPLDCSTSRACGLLDRFSISATPTNPRHSTLPNAPTTLPIELMDLIDIHAAFMTAFSIHCAHNGTHSPANLRDLCQNAARVWGKRLVTLMDLRRVLGLFNANINTVEGEDQKISRLNILDYGHEYICIEVAETKGSAGRVARPVNVNLLNKKFADMLRIAWMKEENVEIQEFVENLPLEPVRRCLSTLRISPSLAKGQRRLRSMRAGVKMKKETSNKVSRHTNGKDGTLLERLRAKQICQATLPPPLSKPELVRKAALDKIEEVCAVMTVLSTSSSIGQQRVSFTLPTIIEKLKDSLRIGRAESETCIKLISTEIAPEWVKIVRIGKTEALVVDRDARPCDFEIQERLKGVVSR
ncbi:hypothetical protein K3495_g9305 [Podosphaera aphanis]|nr:hypothetical protein K3495_g9305 [Podosphaera aphanis]